jgi:prephenate dehydratase
MRRLAYLGPPGTFTEEAALLLDPEAELLPFTSEAAVAAAVEAGEAEEGVLAIENSLEGSVTRTVDALVHDTALAIRGELVLPIEHCLIARQGATKAEVRVICAHPQALGQCRKFIERELPRATEQAALSNVAAVQEALRVEGLAAIGPARAAELYGAEVLERGIQDSAQNQTRFVLLGTSDMLPTGHDKTSLAFTVAHDRPGTLVDVLHEFADRQINLTKIESRPSREELGIYIFLVDMEGHRSDPVVAEALAAVQAKTYIFRVLGSYPRFDDAGDP